MTHNLANPSSRKTFVVELLGQNKSLMMIVKSLMKLKNLKEKTFLVKDNGSNLKPDILFVDCDDEMAIKQMVLRKQSDNSVPVILTSMKENSHSADEYYLPKRKLGCSLLKILDEITVKHFKCAPAMLIGQASVRQAQTPTRTAAQAPARMTSTAQRVMPNRNHLSGRVLVIDDSLAVRTQMKIFLDLYNVNADLVETAEQGIRLASVREYDLIFLDIVLPEMDGYKACKLMRSAEGTKRTPIVMLTSKSSSFNKLRGVMAGCDQYLTKPVNGQQLQTVLLRYMKKKEKAQQIH